MKNKNVIQYISINDAYRDLVIGYTVAVFSRASLPMERGVGCIYSQNRERGHRKLFWGLCPQTPSYYLLVLLMPNVEN